MRVSSDRDDPGYAQYAAAVARGSTYDVELDGELLTRDCVTADEERGEVVRLVRDTHGQLVRDRGTQRVCSECGRFVPKKSGMVRETLHGTVRLIERRRA
jgi:hypothetical protein